MTVEQRAHTAEILTRRLGPEYVASRTGGAAGGLTYLEGSKAFELANLVFGFDGQSICSGSLQLLLTLRVGAQVGRLMSKRSIRTLYELFPPSLFLVDADLNLAVRHHYRRCTTIHRLRQRYRPSHAERWILSRGYGSRKIGESKEQS